MIVRKAALMALATALIEEQPRRDGQFITDPPLKRVRALHSGIMLALACEGDADLGRQVDELREMLAVPLGRAVRQRTEPRQ